MAVTVCVCVCVGGAYIKRVVIKHPVIYNPVQVFVSLSVSH